MQLSEHFTVAEFTNSQTAARLGREIVPTAEQLHNATALCQTVLEPMRQRLARGIVISSGIRPDWLNAAIGGAPGSAHMTGRAADINAIGMSADTLARWIRRQDFPIDKCIVEFRRWVHVQIAEGENKPRNEYLTASVVNGSTIYAALSA